MAVQEEFLVLVMPDAGEMSGELAGGDGVTLLGKRGHVALHRRVEIELPLLVQQGDGGGRERLRYAPDAELRLAGYGLLALGVGVPEPLRPHELPIHRHGYLHPGDPGREPLAHEGAFARDGRGVRRRNPPGAPGNARGSLCGESRGDKETGKNDRAEHGPQVLRLARPPQ